MDLAQRKGMDMSLKNWLAKGRPQVVPDVDDAIDTPLHTAADEGQLAAAVQLIDGGANVNAAGKDGDTPLRKAISKGHLALVELLIAHGADVNSANAKGGTPLSLALYNSHVAIAQLLIANGADVTSSDSFGTTPLHYAVARGQTQVVELLIAKGANVNAVNKKEQRSPLHLMMPASDTTVAKVLIENGASIDAADASGCTPLHFAVRNGHAALADLLIAHGANVNAVAKDGNTPLRIAELCGRSDIVTLLTEHGAVPVAAVQGAEQTSPAATGGLSKLSSGSRGGRETDGPTLDELIQALRRAPAGSELVNKTCQQLVLQVMCGRIDGDRAGYQLRQIMGERDPGQNALANAAMAIGALSAIGK